MTAIIFIMSMLITSLNTHPLLPIPSPDLPSLTDVLSTGRTANSTDSSRWFPGGISRTLSSKNVVISSLRPIVVSIRGVANVSGANGTPPDSPSPPMPRYSDPSRTNPLSHTSAPSTIPTALYTKIQFPSTEMTSPSNPSLYPEPGRKKPSHKLRKTKHCRTTTCKPTTCKPTRYPPTICQITTCPTPICKTTICPTTICESTTCPTTTCEPTTCESTTCKPTTCPPTTCKPTTCKPTTCKPTTCEPTTCRTTTCRPTTCKITTCKPTTCRPTTCKPTTCKPTTCKPTTCKPTTCTPTTCKPTTCKPTTCKPTTCKPTTCKPTTCKPTTCKPTTCKPTTCKPTTCKPTTCKPTTCKPTTCKPTTCKPTTCKPTTCKPTTCKRTTCKPTTCRSTTCMTKTCKTTTCKPTTCRTTTCKPTTCRTTTCKPTTCRTTTCKPTTCRTTTCKTKVYSVTICETSAFYLSSNSPSHQTYLPSLPLPFSLSPNEISTTNDSTPTFLWTSQHPNTSNNLMSSESLRTMIAPATMASMISSEHTETAKLSCGCDNSSKSSASQMKTSRLSIAALTRSPTIQSKENNPPQSFPPVTEQSETIFPISQLNSSPNDPSFAWSLSSDSSNITGITESSTSFDSFSSTSNYSLSPPINETVTMETTSLNTLSPSPFSSEEPTENISERKVENGNQTGFSETSSLLHFATEISSAINLSNDASQRESVFYEFVEMVSENISPEGSAYVTGGNTPIFASAETIGAPTLNYQGGNIVSLIPATERYASVSNSLESDVKASYNHGGATPENQSMNYQGQGNGFLSDDRFVSEQLAPNACVTLFSVRQDDGTIQSDELYSANVPVQPSENIPLITKPNANQIVQPAVNVPIPIESSPPISRTENFVQNSPRLLPPTASLSYNTFPLTAANNFNKLPFIPPGNCNAYTITPSYNYNSFMRAPSVNNNSLVIPRSSNKLLSFVQVAPSHSQMSSREALKGPV